MNKIKTFLANSGGLVLIVVCVFLGGMLVGYLLMPTKIHETTKEVKTYYKAKKVVTLPDGEVDAYGVDSGSQEKDWEKTQVNPKRFWIAPVFAHTMQDGSNSYGILAGATVYGPLGITGGGLWNANQKTSTILVGIMGIF